MLTGREPALSSAKKQGWRMSSKFMAKVLSRAPSGVVSIGAAEQMMLTDEMLLRYHGVMLLIKRGDRDARLILEKQLREGRAVTRASIARRLSNLSWFSARPLLDIALQDTGPRVREGAVFSLGGLSTPEAYKLMFQNLQNERDDLVLMALADALRQAGDADAVPLLAIAIEADDPDVRIKALERLGENGRPQAAPVIAACLSDDDAYVRDAAAQSYLEIRGADGLALLIEHILKSEGQWRLGLLRGMHQAANRLFIRLGTVAHLEALMDMLAITGKDALADTRLRTVMILAGMHEQQRAADLMKAIITAENDPHLQQQMEHAGYSLGAM